MMRLARVLLKGVMAGAAVAFLLSAPAMAQVKNKTPPIEYGDDTSQYANDGECDDPRFVGEGAADVNYPEDAYRDATDCRAAFQAGTVTVQLADSSGIDFGDDTGVYANDNECDDPRFTGPGVGIADPEHSGHDATDCRTLFENYRVTLAEAQPAQPAIDFGDDTSQYANDNECDDPRFVGEGAADVNLPEDAYRDATDCRAAFEAGTVTVQLADSASIDFGDDTGVYANDGECDDPRFTGPGVGIADPEHNGHDATDCRTLFENYRVTLAETTPIQAELDFGDDTSQWANDGECDDPRFVGEGAADENVFVDAYHDATDCRAAYEAGTVTVQPADSAGIDFGDDSSVYANDGECDDPRFTGTGAGVSNTSEHLRHDATDCRTLFESYRIVYEPADVSLIDFGDDTSQWANDGECDDPRFIGPGAALENVEADLRKDATDCRNAFADYSVVQRTALSSALDFGDDTSQWANDGECDDPRFIGSGAASENVEADLRKDATDCIAAFEAGTVSVSTEGVDFGANTGAYADDRECDDQRFSGPGLASYPSERSTDAEDCRALYAAGQVVFRPVFSPDYAAGAPYDSTGIDFGDNTSSYANNGECDDPRFEGPGAAMTLLDEDTLKDAEDCRTLFESGQIALR